MLGAIVPRFPMSQYKLFIFVFNFFNVDSPLWTVSIQPSKIVVVPILSLSPFFQSTHFLHFLNRPISSFSNRPAPKEIAIARIRTSNLIHDLRRKTDTLDRSVTVGRPQF